MRPYLINKTWVDLDTIQSIDEPEPSYNAPYQVEITWQHAFQDKPSKVYLRAPHPGWKDELEEKNHWSLTPDERREVDQARYAVWHGEVRTGVWQAFFDAWTAGRRWHDQGGVIR